MRSQGSGCSLCFPEPLGKLRRPLPRALANLDGSHNLPPISVHGGNSPLLIVHFTVWELQPLAGWGWGNKRTKVMCKVCTWRMASGEGKGPRHLRIQEYFQTKGPRALLPGSSENFCFIRVEEEAAQTHLLAPGTCLFPADLLVLLCGCRAASGTPQCWIGRYYS